MSEEEEIETGTPTAASSSGLIYVFLLTLPACPSPHPGLPSAQPAHPASSAVISGLPGYGGTQGGDSESLSSGRTTASLDAEGEARVGTASGTQGGPMVGLPCMLLNEERGPCLLHSRSPRPPIRQLHHPSPLPWNRCLPLCPAQFPNPVPSALRRSTAQPCLGRTTRDAQNEGSATRPATGLARP